MPNLFELLDSVGLLKEAGPEQLPLPGVPSSGPIFRGGSQTVGPAFSQQPIPDAGLQKGKLLGKGSLVQRAGSQVAQGAKDLWAGGSQYKSRGGKMLGGVHKLRNRAGILGGLAALAGGIPLYMASQKQREQQAMEGVTPETFGENPAFTQQPMAQPMAQEQPYRGEYGAEPQYTDADFERMLAQMYPEFGKYSNYSPSASSVAAPPHAPRVTSPGPSVAGIPQIKPGEPPKLPGMGLGSAKAPSAPSAGSAPKMPSMPKKAESDAVYPLLAAGAGGLGGWAAGKKLVEPLIKAKERTLQAKIQNAQAALKGVQSAGKAAPATVAAAGALLLAALTALKIQKNKNSSQFAMPQYDTTGAGFQPHERQEFGTY